MKTRVKIIFLLFFLVSYLSFLTTAEAGKKDISKQSKKTKSSISYSTIPFDITAEKLSKGYQGHSLLDIYQKLTIPHPKGEFETTEEYEARVARWKLSPILGQITPSDTLAFEILDVLAPDALSLKYDADSEELTAKIKFETHDFNDGKTRWLETYYRSKNLGSHMGVTRMGVKFKVTSHVGTSIGIGVKEQIEPISISRKFSRDEALKLKLLTRVYAIVSLDEPYKVDDSTSSSASLDNPNEWYTKYLGLYVNLKAIILVNIETGEIIAKAEAPFKRCSYDICI